MTADEQPEAPADPAASSDAALDASIRQFWSDFVGHQIATGRQDVGRMLETALEFFFERSLPASSPQASRQAQIRSELRSARTQLSQYKKGSVPPEVQRQVDYLTAQQETLAGEVAAFRQTVARRLHFLSPQLYATGQALLAAAPGGAAATSPKAAEARSPPLPETPPDEAPEQAEAEPEPDVAPRPWLSKLSGMSSKLSRALGGSREAAPPPSAEAPPADGRFREFEDLAATWLKGPRKGP